MVVSVNEAPYVTAKFALVGLSRVAALFGGDHEAGIRDLLNEIQPSGRTAQ